MKIGIITWFTGPNYGTNLQAIALQWYLRNQGYYVQIINYEVQDVLIKVNFIKRIKNKIEHIRMKNVEKKYADEIKRKNERLINSIKDNCILTEKIKSEEQLIGVCNSFDLLIIGSDQIWNPNWYHKFYYADYISIKTRRVSYAPSMGVNTISSKRKMTIVHGIQKFDKVSVREEKTAELLSSYLEEKPEVVVDPTFLLNQREWIKIFPIDNRDKKDDYILSMFLSDNDKHWHAVSEFSLKNKIKNIIIPYCSKSYFQNGEIKADVGLNELLNLIRNAKFILTDSFHITVFSIINKRQFYTFQRFKENKTTSQNLRVTNLLKTVGLLDRYVEYNSKIIKEKEPIKYSEHMLNLEKEIVKSKHYLNDAINGKERN